MALLLHALLFALCLGALHLAMSQRGPLSPVSFCAAAAASHVVVGLAVALPAMSGQAGRAWTTAWWLPAYALGLFASGVALGAAWLGVVHGLKRVLRRAP